MRKKDRLIVVGIRRAMVETMRSGGVTPETYEKLDVMNNVAYHIANTLGDNDKRFDRDEFFQELNAPVYPHHPSIKKQKI